MLNIKSARVDVLSIQLNTDNLTVIQAYLEHKLASIGDLRSMPFTLDVQALTNPQQIDLPRLMAIFAKHGLRIIALRHTQQEWAAIAKQYRLAFSLLPQEKAHANIKQVVAHIGNSQANTPSPQQEKLKLTANQTTSTIVVERPIRTGQQVYAEQADLIILGLVSEGAEIIADGNIHVYAPLRGRALAGASGNRQARIFIHNMQAELVSVAGIYRIFDQNLPAHLDKKPVQVFLQNDRLVISAI